MNTHRSSLIAHCSRLPYTCFMCGIAGVYNTTGREPELATLRKMAGLIGHRGPDGERFYIEGGVGLAHRHLRIIDLSDAAMQPMSNSAGTLQLIFNGEIYNYIELRAELQASGHNFRTRSDTEVMLHAYERWGVDCLHRFNGMFAFALWDSSRHRLFVARDRLGVKPLYYHWNGSAFVFASEIKALFAHTDVPRTPNITAATQYLNSMYTTGEQTWFAGVKRLLPGHFMLVDSGGPRITQWWDIPGDEDAPGARPARYYVAKTRHLLEDSVRLRMRSDVPLGAHLSGGIDSSAVVALLSKRLAPLGQSVRTFSGAFAEGEQYDERRYIHAVRDLYKTEHAETVPYSTILPDLMDRLVWHMDEPAAGPGIILQWAVCELTRNAGVKVINGGQGGDEAWGGYLGYIPSYLQTLLAQSRRDPKLLLSLASNSGRLLASNYLRESLFRALANRKLGRSRPSSMLPLWAGELFRDNAGDVARSRTDFIDTEAQTRRTPLAQALYWDLKWYLPALLQVEDRTSMAFSLESRAPLLDYRLIEHAATVPSLLKMKGLTTKYILRRAVKDMLPAAVYARTDKMGMPTPIALWFRVDLRSWVEERLLSDEVAATSLLDMLVAKRIIEEHVSGRYDRSLDIWKMLNLTSWWRLFIDQDLPTDQQTPAKQVELIAT